MLRLTARRLSFGRVCRPCGLPGPGALLLPRVAAKRISTGEQPGSAGFIFSDDSRPDKPLRLVNSLELTPDEVVAALDEHIIAQQDAKKAVAIALRNRWRRQTLPEDLQKEIYPMNILMVGPTGSGKTEIARRLAKLVNAPFVKTEATRFTETGIVGSNTQEMVEDLMEAAIQLETDAARERVRGVAQAKATEIIVDALLKEQAHGTRESLRSKVNSGDLDHSTVKVSVRPPSSSGGAGGLGGMLGNIFGGKMPPGMGGLGRGGKIGMAVNVPPEAQKAMDKLFGGGGGGGTEEKAPPQSMPIRTARQLLFDEQVEKLVDLQAVTRTALAAAESSGIIFIDEIDKITGAGIPTSDGRGGGSSFHKGEGVQKEGTRVQTRHGNVDTSHVLFLTAGAFHRSKPSDLLPELQGRLPIRVTLRPLKQEDLVRVLTEPNYNLVRQTKALLGAEGLCVDFTDDGVQEIARVAAEMNATIDDIGARRLRTVMAKVTEELSFTAHRLQGTRVAINKPFVAQQLTEFYSAQDLNKYIL